MILGTAIRKVKLEQRRKEMTSEKQKGLEVSHGMEFGFTWSDFGHDCGF